jgi:hypothetical protein
MLRLTRDSYLNRARDALVNTIHHEYKEFGGIILIPTCENILTLYPRQPLNMMDESVGRYADVIIRPYQMT